MRSDYFDDMYASDPDPWGFTSRWYEQRKYAMTLAALTRQRYRSVFEPGCSIGVLTAALAARCDRLLAVDIAERALEEARRRTSALANVVVQEWSAGSDPWPDTTFDLIVASEMLYYLEPDQVDQFFADAVDRLDSDGEIVVVHWRPKVPEYPLTGDEVREIARAVSGLHVVGAYEDADVVLDVLSAWPGRSVAALEGLRD